VESDNFGDLLKRYRERAHVTQEELAERAGLSVDAVGALERGVRRRPQPVTRRLLADALRLTDAERATFVGASEGVPQRPRFPAWPAWATPLTPLIGRERDTARVADRLREPEARFLTITGPGGVGKTRLALQAARELGADFPDGVVPVQLGPIREPDLVVPAIAQALGVQAAGGRDLTLVVRTFLARKHTLLLLDNFEQVLAAGVEITQLLAACPNLKVLVTSREVLRLSGEQEYALAPLAAPDRWASREALFHADAVRLFAARARAVNLSFELTEENVPLVAEICRRLDGLPLAIELAAARIRVLSPGSLLARLERRLAVLTSGSRDAPARQQTLRDTIAWSYSLLPGTERQIFRRLGVFVGTFTLEAATVVSRTDDPLHRPIRNQLTHDQLQMLHALDSLVGKSLLNVGWRGGDDRYAMLETIREFAVDELERAGEAEVYHERHACFFADLAESAADGLRGAEQEAWSARLDRDEGNVLAAVAWSRGGQPGGERFRLATRIGGALGWWWFITGRPSDGRLMLDTIIAAYDRGAWEPAASVGLGKVLVYAGLLAFDRNDLPGAEKLCARVLNIADADLDAGHIAMAQVFLAIVAALRGEAAVTEVHLKEARATLQRTYDRWGDMWVNLVEGEIARWQGNTDRALAGYEAAEVLTRPTGDNWFLAMTLLNQANVRLGRGEVDSAHATYLEALALGRQTGSRLLIAYPLVGLVEVASARGDAVRAARLYGAIDALFLQIGTEIEAVDRREYERYVAVTKAKLGETEFRAEYRVGQTLDLHQTISYALESADGR
jgi:predicted ATPase/DNA-binding XRE family transcriptional regulator